MYKTGFVLHLERRCHDKMSDVLSITAVIWLLGQSEKMAENHGGAFFPRPKTETENQRIPDIEISDIYSLYKIQ